MTTTYLLYCKHMQCCHVSVYHESALLKLQKLCFTINGDVIYLKDGIRLGLCDSFFFFYI